MSSIAIHHKVHAAEHGGVLIDAVLLIALAAVAAGDTLGLGRWWAGLGIVRRFAALR